VAWQVPFAGSLSAASNRCWCQAITPYSAGSPIIKNLLRRGHLVTATKKEKLPKGSVWSGLEVKTPRPASSYTARCCTSSVVAAFTIPHVILRVTIHKPPSQVSPVRQQRAYGIATTSGPSHIHTYLAATLVRNPNRRKSCLLPFLPSRKSARHCYCPVPAINLNVSVRVYRQALQPPKPRSLLRSQSPTSPLSVHRHGLERHKRSTSRIAACLVSAASCCGSAFVALLSAVCLPRYLRHQLALRLADPRPQSPVNRRYRSEQSCVLALRVAKRELWMMKLRTLS